MRNIKQGYTSEATGTPSFTAIASADELWKEYRAYTSARHQRLTANERRVLTAHRCRHCIAKEIPCKLSARTVCDACRRQRRFQCSLQADALSMRFENERCVPADVMRILVERRLKQEEQDDVSKTEHRRKYLRQCALLKREEHEKIVPQKTVRAGCSRARSGGTRITQRFPSQTSLTHWEAHNHVPESAESIVPSSDIDELASDITIKQRRDPPRRVRIQLAKEVIAEEGDQESQESQKDPESQVRKDRSDHSGRGTSSKTAGSTNTAYDGYNDGTDREPAQVRANFSDFREKHRLQAMTRLLRDTREISTLRHALLDVERGVASGDTVHMTDLLRLTQDRIVEWERLLNEEMEMLGPIHVPSLQWGYERPLGAENEVRTVMKRRER